MVFGILLWTQDDLRLPAGPLTTEKNPECHPRCHAEFHPGYQPEFHPECQDQ